MSLIIPNIDISHEKLNIINHYYINFKYGRHYYNYTNIYDGFSYTIDRSAAEDVYNYKLDGGHTWANDNANLTVSMLPTISVNNSDKHSWNPPQPNQIYNVKLLEKMNMVHNSKFGSPHLVDTDQIAIGGNMVDISKSTPIWRKVMFIDNNARDSKTIKVGNFENVYRFDSIAQVYGAKRFDKNYSPNENMTNSAEKLPDSLPNYKYSYAYVVPVKPDVIGENNVIANIYYSHDSGVDHDWYDDLKVKTDKLNSSSINGLETYFHQEVDKTNKLNVNEKFEDPYKVGEIRMKDRTYFDYEKGKTEKGYDPSSVPGNPIPYNYEGNFTRQINFSLNHVFQNISLNLSTDIKMPYLNPSNGEIRLTINETKPDNQDIPLNYFDKDNIKLIRSGMIKTLLGFQRLSNEKQKENN